MDISIILGVCILFLFVLIVGVHFYIEQRNREKARLQKETRRLNQLIQATEELLEHACNLPLSPTLYACLNHRILSALQALATLYPQELKWQHRIADIEHQLQEIEKSQLSGGFSNTLSIPKSDQEAVGLLKLVKRLREVMKAEHIKGKLTTPIFISENNHLESIQLMINVESILKRVTELKNTNQYGLAQQLLEKALMLLQDQQDEYCQSSRQKSSDSVG